MKARLTGAKADKPDKGMQTVMTASAMREWIEYTEDMPEPKRTALRTFRVNGSEEALRDISEKLADAIFTNADGAAYLNGRRIEYGAYIRQAKERE